MTATFQPEPEKASEAPKHQVPPPHGVRTAFVLAAGYGTRLRPLTDRYPKPLLPLGGKRVIERIFERLQSVGIERIIINTHHLSERFSEAYPEGKWQLLDLHQSHEPIILDTGGGLRNILDLLDPELDQHLLVHNGDILSDINFNDLISSHLSEQAAFTLALRTALAPQAPKANIQYDPDSASVLSIRNQPPVIQNATACGFTGIYVASRKAIENMPTTPQGPKPYSIVKTWIELIQKSQNVKGLLMDEGDWTDIGTIEEFEKLNTFLAADLIRDETPKVLPTFKAGSFELESLRAGGSSKSFYRLHREEALPQIALHYSVEKEEDEYFCGIAEFMANYGIHVPAIYGEDPQKHLVWMEDLGTDDLYLHRHEDWDHLQPLYLRVLEDIAILHDRKLYDAATAPDPSKRGNAALTLMPGFDDTLYTWEQGYFTEHLLGTLLQIQNDLPVSQKELEAEFLRLRKSLIEAPPSLVHRDLQSKNIILHEGQPYLIDFQGMRTGTAFYDLGSLLYDPYMPLVHEQRVEALKLYYHINHHGLSSWEDFTQMFYRGSAQRLFQAGGAYGFLSKIKGKREFLNYVHPGLRNLCDALRRCGEYPALLSVAEKALQVSLDKVRV